MEAHHKPPNVRVIRRRERKNMSTVVLRIRELEKRVAKLEGIPTGYVCVGCKRRQPKNHYIYSAYNSETHEEIRPLCSDCIRGALQTVKGPPWKHNGPYPQNDQALPHGGAERTSNANQD